MRSIYHTGITVSDLERAIEFYHNVLGLEFASVPTGYVNSPEIDAALRVPDAKLRLVNLRAGDNSIIEVIEYKSPPSAHDRAVSCNTIGSAHIAFLVDDIFAKKAELESKGVDFFSGVNYVEEPTAAWYWVYFADPDGIPLELMQFVYEKPDAIAADVASYKQARGLA